MHHVASHDGTASHSTTASRHARCIAQQHLGISPSTMLDEASTTCQILEPELHADELENADTKSRLKPNIDMFHFSVYDKVEMLGVLGMKA